MKAYLIAFLIAMAVSAWAFDSGSPPQPVKAGIDDVKEAMKRQTRTALDYTYADFSIVDSARSKTYATQYVDNSSKAGTFSTFPMSAAR